MLEVGTELTRGKEPSLTDSEYTGVVNFGSGVIGENAGRRLLIEIGDCDRKRALRGADGFVEALRLGERFLGLVTNVFR